MKLFSIATRPSDPRDHCRLLVIDRASGAIEHRRFYEIVDFFKSGDCLVLNNSKVFPARIPFEVDGKKGELLLGARPNGQDSVLAKMKSQWAKKLGGQGRTVVFQGDAKGTVRILGFDEEKQAYLVRVDCAKSVEEIGLPPLPPYILKTRKVQQINQEDHQDSLSYQCVYAREQGSVAGPTAGFHWTPDLLKKVEEQGVNIVTLTLHIGFASLMKAPDESVNRLPAERFEVSSQAAQAVNQARLSGKRVVACGTSATRTLETLADTEGRVKQALGETDLFIKPGYRFKAVGVLLTNFHLPDSTNFMLTQSFVGAGADLLSIYQEAARQDYRFFSYGDAMLIL